MSVKHIIEAWRDEEYRENLDAEMRAQLPGNPAGEIELTEAELAGVDGGTIAATIAWSLASSDPCAASVAMTIISLVHVFKHDN